jgi:hypothetical protein
VTGAGKPEHVQGLDVTDGVLPILGVTPVAGRLFNRRDDSAGAPQTVVLSYGYWQRKFGGASSVVGRSITVDGKPREIIGVLPQGFRFLDQTDAALFLPFQWDRNKTKLGNFSENALARLKPGVTMAQASADMARIRMPLGAQRETLTAMFVRQGLRLTLIGAACGLVTAFVSMRLMSSLLFNVSPVDPITYLTITTGVVAVAYLACYLPSRRAATVEPMEALRTE